MYFALFHTLMLLGSHPGEATMGGLKQPEEEFTSKNHKLLIPSLPLRLICVLFLSPDFLIWLFYVIDLNYVILCLE